MKRRWIIACAAAEAIGMAAAAVAARAADGLLAETHALVPLAFAIVLAGGLAEGIALGTLQARALAHLLDRPRRRQWALATVLVAGLGWAAGSAPALLSGSGHTASPQPDTFLLLLASALLGAGLGALLGLAQAPALRDTVRHPWRWAAFSALGWTLAMPLVFLGASTAGADWSWPVLACWGALTGALAGAGLGAVTGALLPCLDGPGLRDHAVLGLIRLGLAPDGLVGLRLIFPVTGRRLSFPVMTAPTGCGGELVVLVGHHERKRWWRAVAVNPDVSLMLGGRWRSFRALVLRPGERGWDHARAAHSYRWPRVAEGDDVLVVLTPARGDQGPTEPGPEAVRRIAGTS